MKVKRTRISLKDIFDSWIGFAFLLSGSIKRQRGSVYPVHGVFLAEIRGKDEGFMP